MPLTAGVPHLATATADLDRLIAFYADVLDAKVQDDMSEDGLRHAFIDLGGGTVLHPFQIPGVEVPQGELPMFQRGRIDHMALAVRSIEAFEALRERIVAAGAGDGEVVDLGPLLIVGFNDPDGLWGEVCWEPPDGGDGRKGLRSEWRYVPYPEPVR